MRQGRDSHTNAVLNRIQEGILGIKVGSKAYRESQESSVDADEHRIVWASVGDDRANGLERIQKVLAELVSFRLLSFCAGFYHELQTVQEAIHSFVNAGTKFLPREAVDLSSELTLPLSDVLVRIRTGAGLGRGKVERNPVADLACQCPDGREVVAELGGHASVTGDEELRPVLSVFKSDGGGMAVGLFHADGGKRIENGREQLGRGESTVSRGSSKAATRRDMEEKDGQNGFGRSSMVSWSEQERAFLARQDSALGAGAEREPCLHAHSPAPLSDPPARSLLPLFVAHRAPAHPGRTRQRHTHARCPSPPSSASRHSRATRTSVSPTLPRRARRGAELSVCHLF